MSYNGSGTFQINTSGQPVVAGTVISSTAFNALTADLATGLSTAITKDGQTTTTARIPFAAGINSSSATDSTNTSTGSIITSGGVGIAKALYVGTTANVAGAVTLQSTLGVTGVATFSAAPIYSSLTASSAVATDASKALVSVTNTGTGNNVLATSPTLVTPVLGAASATSVTFDAGAVGTPSITTTGDTNTGIFFPAADTIAFSEGGVEAMRIDSSGNVGIGGAPTQKLDVYGGAGAAVAIIRAASGQNSFFSVAGNGNTFLSTSFDLVQDSTNLAQIAQRANAAMAFSTNNTERMRIDSSGNVRINNTNTSLWVGTEVLTSFGFSLFKNSGTPALVWNTDATGTLISFSVANRTDVGSISYNGSLTLYNQTSDYRLKTVIGAVADQGARIDALEPIEYTWNSNGIRSRGFLAHKFQEVYANSVTGTKDAVDEKGNPEYQSMQASSSEVIADLVAEIQSLRKRLTALESN